MATLATDPGDGAFASFPFFGRTLLVSVVPQSRIVRLSFALFLHSS